MGSSLPKFGQIDLELDAEPGSKTTASPAPRRATPSFGELDLESIGAPLQDSEPDVARSAAKRPPKETPTRQSIEAVRLAEEETRIAKAGVVDEAISRSRHPIDADAATRIGSFEAAPPSSRRNAPSSSGVASRDDRVAVMRELYAQGNAEAALVLAAELSSDMDNGDVGSSDPDPFGGLIPVDEDPFGGLEPIVVDDDDPQEHTAILEASADSSRLAVMTSRQVPRLLVGPKEISKLPMDPRAAFILGHIDGIQSMEEILDVCAMPEAEAIELIERLRRMGVISLH